MSAFTTYLVPTLWAVLFHALVVGMLLYNWEGEKTVEVTDVEPYYIEANIVAENPHRARERREASEAAAREQARRQQQARERAEREAAAKAAADRQARLDAERLDAERLEQEARERELEERRARELADAEAAAQSDEDAEAMRMSMADDLARAVMSEQSARQAVTDYEKAMAYASRIRQDIIQQWSRPPSARNGMQALLQVNLVPTGEVVDVIVLEGSGNDAFDRSAILAVEKAERFVVPNDSRQFETHFREFEVLFRPEDLRL